MSEPKTTSSVGIGLGGWMFLIFLTLKLTGVIDWSYWWITAPLWGEVLLVLAVCALGALILGGVAAIVKIASLGKKK